VSPSLLPVLLALCFLLATFTLYDKSCTCFWLIIRQVEGVTTIGPKDGVVHEGKAYCFAGSPVWQALVKEGKVTRLISHTLRDYT
jgi:hypothetical protein